MNLPVAPVTGYEVGHAGQPIARIRCPYCDKIHRHSAEMPGTTIDQRTRVSHCRNGGYIMQDRELRNNTDEHVLYRFFDDNGALLYIGITNNPRSRFGGHRITSEWWNRAASVTMKRYSSRKELEAAEIRAIKSEKPLHNRAHIDEPPKSNLIQMRSSNRRAIPLSAECFQQPDAIACDDE